MYHVIIVEDDPMVASINRRYLQADPLFQVTGEFRNGRDALESVKEHPTDLAIIDYYMPLMDGREFIRSCHEQQLKLDFIMITAANSSKEIEEILQLGVIDYLVKPFTAERFCQAVQKYRNYKEVLQADGPLSQEHIDRILSPGPPAAPAQLLLEKGLQPQTLTLIRECLKQNPDSALCSNEIAARVSLSRITVRRYVNYLLENQEITSQVDYATGGRPSIRYRIRQG